MSFSLGLTLYNLGARRLPRLEVARPARPAGRLVWLHASGADHRPGLSGLARRLVEDEGFAVLLTTPEAAAAGEEGAGAGATISGIVAAAAPPDTPAEAREFLNYWAPDLVVMTGGELRPALLDEAQRRGLPLLLAEGRHPHLLAGRDGWYPGLVRRALAAHGRLHLIDSAAERAFRKAGADPTRLRVTGRLELEPLSLPYHEGERSALSALLGGRPVWLAIDVPPEEEALVIAAHRRALALSHRLLLILAPRDAARAPDLAAAIEAEEGWQVARRGAEEEPEPETQVYLADQPGEAGLWYRLAPVTYLGGSLQGQGANLSPFEAATAGSALLMGPRLGPHAAAGARLGAAMAARLVATGTDLSFGLGDLLSPDRAARQAHAAWNVLSEGTAASEALLDDIRALLGGGA